MVHFDKLLSSTSWISSSCIPPMISCCHHCYTHSLKQTILLIVSSQHMKGRHGRGRRARKHYLNVLSALYLQPEVLLEEVVMTSQVLLPRRSCWQQWPHDPATSVHSFSFGGSTPASPPLLEALVEPPKKEGKGWQSGSGAIWIGGGSLECNPVIQCSPSCGIQGLWWDMLLHIALHEVTICYTWLVHNPSFFTKCTLFLMLEKG